MVSIVQKNVRGNVENWLKFKNIDGMDILFRNFRGEGTRYNADGKRNFNVIVPNDVAEQLIDSGWHLRILKPRDEDEDPKYCLKVSLNIGGRSPLEVWQYTRNGRVLLDEEMIENLDWADIERADFVVSPHEYEPGKFTGWLYELRVWLAESMLDEDEYPADE